ncbi:MAG TPA: TlpA disulfide reductase family protein [Candidatus Hydrogenedentes bacterium]|nr:TlpA disulfide reductase family protein [Candidatus Hydrogenedentota bacterium]HQM47254.1 TlpA disulfide reductase family protein [Candidatus Hydrogenedentota bacterium]
MRKPCSCLVFAFALCAAVPAAALAVGDAVPPLRLGEWVKPGPVDLLDFSGSTPKTFFLIEFWATWCQPCRMMMPHINELQRQYAGAGLVVIGVSNEDPETVRAFVASTGADMSYAVAVDSRNRDVYNAYMRPVGSPGLPHAFLIDREGMLAWHGVPAARELDPLIERIAGKQYTLKSEQLAQRAERLIPRYFATVKRGDEAEAATLGQRILEWGTARPDMLRGFAWRILTEPGLETRDAETALRAATAAVQAAPEDFRALETLAHALAESGKSTDAVETQKKAIAACPDEVLRKSMQDSLEEFLALEPKNPTQQ